LLVSNFQSAISIVIPLSLSSGALSIDAKSLISPHILAVNTAEIPAVVVVLP
jgi:hypothetical protein